MDFPLVNNPFVWNWADVAGFVKQMAHDPTIKEVAECYGGRMSFVVTEPFRGRFVITVLYSAHDVTRNSAVRIEDIFAHDFIDVVFDAVMVAQAMTDIEMHHELVTCPEYLKNWRVTRPAVL